MSEDGAKPSEVENELAIFKAQLAYGLICTGRRAEAEELCRDVIRSRCVGTACW